LLSLASLVLAGAALLAGQSLAAQTATPAAANPNGRLRVSPGPLNLNDADFWVDPRRTRAEIEQPLLRADHEALLFDAPAVVTIDNHDSLPTQALRVASLATLRQWPFRESAVIVGVDLVNNVVQAALAIEPPDRQVEAMPRSDAPAQAGMGSETYTIELRNRLNLPWESGRFQARLIVADQMTPARDIELKMGAAHVDPEVERYQADQRNKTRVPALMPAPGGASVSYARDDLTPALPEAQGMNLSAPRVCALDTSTPCMLRGSFRLPVLKRHIVPPGAATAGTEALREQWAAELAQGRRLPSAVVPISVVAVGSQMTGPVVWRLVLPVFEALDFRGTRPMGIGTFAIDVRQLESFGAVQQTWFLYAFSDEATSGPLTVGVTRRPRTP